MKSWLAEQVLYKIMGDKKSRSLLLTVGILVMLSIGATYYKTMVLRDFVIIDDLDEGELIEE